MALAMFMSAHRHSQDGDTRGGIDRYQEALRLTQLSRDPGRHAQVRQQASIKS